MTRRWTTFFAAVVLVAATAVVGTAQQNYLDVLRAKVAQGDAIAAFALGLNYDLGKGVPQDHEEAARLWRLAAGQGEAYGQSNLVLTAWTHYA